MAEHGTIFNIYGEYKVLIAIEKEFDDYMKAMMKEFSFDKNRLELAKMAYRNCVDKRNYFELYDTFDFESYARELNKFVQNQR